MASDDSEQSKKQPSEALIVRIRDQIRRQYHSVRNFAKQSGIPYSTLHYSLKNGLDGTAYGTVMRICSVLNITPDEEDTDCMPDPKYGDLYEKLTCLDVLGVHTIRTILDVEAERSKRRNMDGRL